MRPPRLRPARNVMLTDDLLAYVFDGRSHLLARPMATWLASLRRFTAFVTTFRDKIRKKIRATIDRESLLDLRLELETAFLLLRERPLSLVYEPEQSGQARAPDFAVSYTTSLTFMVEVTRLRADQKGGPISPIGERLADTICTKLAQLVPQRSNVLLVGTEAFPTDSGLSRVMLRILQRAESGDPTFLRRHRFRDRADFFRHYQRLSQILVHRTPLQAGDSAVVWVNPAAKYPLPSKVRTALSRSHTSLATSSGGT
jgi:hypothetical protein